MPSGVSAVLNGGNDMRFVHRHHMSAHGAAPGEDEDPLAGIANLFDVSVAFIVALLIALSALFSMQGLLDPGQSFALVKQNADGSMELITKEQEKIKVQKVMDRTLSGQGVRLGTAYRLADGQVVYVPETP